MHFLTFRSLLARLVNVTCSRNGGGRRFIQYSVLEKDQSFAVGDQLHGYTVEKVVPVSELSLTAVHLQHHSGAQHLHISRQDSNNVFGVALRTTPRDSTGIPHILEHLSLCGSTRYPIRDPFFKMLTRSLSTFMNAFTASDWTMYPFSTQNYQDYQNLMSVYLDAVFFPLLRHLDFCQEGWRLEHENPSDKSSMMIFKGVVYNEMKGAFSNSQQLFAERCQNYLLPSHTYGVVSGGDPAFIPDLLYDKLKEFHAYYYHPSNARFYTYGNFPLEEHLQRIDEQVLSRFQRASAETSVPCEPRWQTPREAVVHCAPDPMSPDPDKQTTVAVNYLLTDITHINESCALSILSSLFVDGEKSPFYQSLLESGIGSDYAPTTGYNSFMREAMFSVGLQRIATSDVNRVKEVIDTTFDKVIKDGFEPERIEAILHKIELGLKHQTEKFGLNLGVSILPCWTHDGHPTEVLQINKQVNWFKNQLQSNPRFLQDLVVKYFKNNLHKLTVVMTPQEDYSEKCRDAEARKLMEKVSLLTSDERENVFKTGKELIEQQSKVENVDCLPTLSVSDIERHAEHDPFVVKHKGQVSMQLCSQPTNEVTYFRAVSSIVNLPTHLKPYVPLFCDIVTKMGAGSMDYQQLSQQIELKTGAMEAGPHLAEHHSNSSLSEQSILFTSYCLNRNVEAMLHLWTEIFNSLSLADTTRLQTLIQILASEKSSDLSDCGHQYAMTHAASTLQSCSAARELMSGLTQVDLMKNLAELSQHGELIAHMKDIAGHVLSADNMRCCITSTPDCIDSVQTLTEKFIETLPTSLHGKKDLEFFAEEGSFTPSPSYTHCHFPFQVNYVACSLPTVPYCHPHFASLRVLAKLLTMKYLHREIREKGGAYGGGANSQHHGLFHFYSYRDPNLQQTLDRFAASAVWAANGEFTDRDVDEAKLAVFSQVDSPVPPGRKGLRYFMYGIDDSAFQSHREQLLEVGRNGIIDAAQAYLIDNHTSGSVTVLGPENAVTSDSEVWTVKKHE